MVYLPGDGRVVVGAPAEILAACAIAPPLVELGRLAGWSPLPLSVRDARRRAGELRARLASALPPPARRRPRAVSPAPTLRARGVVVRYGDLTAVAGVDLDLWVGEIVALMGRNGSGKSSLLWALQGTGTRQAGRVSVAAPGVPDGAPPDPKALPARSRRRLVGLVPQTPGDLLYLDTVDAECAQADRESDAPPGACRALLDRLVPQVPGDRHPRDLSEGQRLALALAVQLVAAPPVVLLDEPTRGLDYTAKRAFGDIVRMLAAEGRAVVLATHDVELVAGVADRVVVLAEGEIVADGPTPEVVVASPAFAPQVAKVLAPQRWLTVADVAAALESSR
jgi:energy-coupling factor transport system ATP-binding protein